MKKTFMLVLLFVMAVAGAQDLPFDRPLEHEQVIHTTTLVEGRQNLQSFSALTVRQQLRLKKKENGFVLQGRTLSMRDSVVANGEEVVYTAAAPEASLGQQAIKKRLSEPVGIYLNKEGLALGDGVENSQPLLDLLGLAGPHLPVATACLVFQPQRKQWKTEYRQGDLKVKTSYRRLGNEAGLERIAFHSTTESEKEKVLVNGVMAVETATGLVVYRQSRSVTSAYRLINGHWLPVQVWQERFERLSSSGPH